MTDLRERLARIGAATRAAPPTEGETADPRQPRQAAFTVAEQRIAIDELGLEVVGRGAPDPLTLAHLGLRGEAPKRWEDIVFLDTETTGLSGGAGTYVFLLGIAWLEEGTLVLRQLFLEDLAAERAFVTALQSELARFRACASYNGKSFDIPLLRARFVLALRAELSVDESHLDLLHPARRMWRRRFDSVTLREIEESVLDDGRIDDIPSALIPDRYFQYLRRRDPAIIEPVMRHNARDVISLVRVADRIARAVMDARTGRAPDHAPAALSMARAFDRQGELEAAFCCYESAYVDGDLELRVLAALPFARALERRGEAARALRMVETLLELGLGSPRWREQAEARVRRLCRQRWQSELAAAI